MKINIEIDNLTEAQAVAIEDLLATWVSLGKMGSSRWTGFFADGDGNFRPQILLDGRNPKFTDLLSKEEKWDGENYMIDFDRIAWKLHEDKTVVPTEE